MQIDSHLEKSEHLLDLLETNNVDSTLQKSIMRLKYLHPTYLQSKLFSLQTPRTHFFLSSGIHSGKTITMGLYLIHHLLQTCIKNNQTKDSIINNKIITDSSEIPVGIFTVFLCSSREICSKNTALLQDLLHFVEKPYKLTVRNLMDFEANSLNLAPNFNYILIATPTTFLSFQRTLQLDLDFYKALILDDSEYLISFGYRSELLEIKNLFTKQRLEKIMIMISSSEGVDDYLKQEFLKKCVKISIEDSEEETFESPNALQLSQINQIYHIGPNIHKYILLYLSFKLKFIFGKTIILCKDVPSLYKVEIFLKRAGIEQTHIYNPKDPKNLRSYIVSVFNSGLLQILITTTDFFQDIKQLKTLQKAHSETREKVWKKLYLKNVQNLIIFDLNGLESAENYFDYFEELFKTRSTAHKTLISLCENSEQEIELFSQVMEIQKRDYKSLNLNEFPLSQKEIDAFDYRISDVLRGITKKQLHLAQMLDFKRQMMKSKNLQGFFKEHQEEKTLLQEEIKRLSNDLNKFAIRLYEDIPSYLLPESLKQQNGVYNLNTMVGKKRKIGLSHWNENFEESLKKRMVNNGLSIEDVKNKGLEMKEKHVIIDEDKEDPNVLDPNYLKPLSNRKMWKIKHKFKLQHKNQRLEKKGIFT